MHDGHDDKPAALDALPCRQSRHVEAPPKEYRPAPQVVHVCEEVAPAYKP